MDPALQGGGVPPVHVMVTLDAAPVLTVLANLDRPDLVKAKVAPNPFHGFDAQFPERWVRL